MSRSLNKVTLIGNLGNDPEVRSTTGGNRVATFSLATSRSWNDAGGREAGEDGVASLRGVEHEELAARRHRREVREEGRQALRRRAHRVSPVAGQGEPDALQHRDQRPRADHARRRQGRWWSAAAATSRATRAASRVRAAAPAKAKARRGRRRLRGFPGRAGGRGRRSAVLTGLDVEKREWRALHGRSPFAYFGAHPGVRCKQCTMTGIMKTCLTRPAAPNAP